ncbi:phosphoglycerate kinase [Candidatus Uhrbacteria bacterium CG_4_9_14_3_um_filter_50_9]|uniref:Phosphoglycerate kinase n=1 Tax=Candidatus Uhrbacteria bacterium CG_4_9_14_3_um_filter_50_9 TaxID=1975035 RepID=A0A2M7XDF6_9BACT|nr:MAG: phosphoglycerate kinase [Candidatus Uhrbacteria bacterium CG_4_9_14_3_um_filter_50_9]
MKLKRVRSDMNLKGKRVLVRIDANVPVKHGRALDGPHGRIAKAAVGLDWLLQRGARVIVMTHLGRPNGRRLASGSVAPVAKRLSSLLKFKVKTTKGVTGKDVERAVERLQDGELLLLENLRFDKREKENDESFAKELAVLADLYVDDAFGVAHRGHTSLVAITKELPSYAGPLLANEVTTLEKLDREIKHPFLLIIGGMKIETKLPVIRRFAGQVDHVLVGGALATTFFAAQQKQVGKSVHDEGAIHLAAKELMLLKEKMVLPVDVVVAKSLRADARHRVTDPDSVNVDERIMDVGPETIRQYQELIESAKTIVWNGPLGYCEIPVFCHATQEIAKAIADRTGKATTIVGGGDTGPALESLNLADKFTLLSTGGGAMLQLLGGKPLPAVEALRG